MRSDVLRVYKTVHTWTGVICGLALFICFYAGALTMFKDALADWVTPPDTTTQLIRVDQAPALIAQVLASQPDARKTLTLRLHDPAHGWLSWPVQQGARHASATADARGQLRIALSQPSDVASFIDVLHMTAGLPGGYGVGMSAMGVVSLLYGLALVSGVIVLLPTLLHDLFLLRIGKNLKRMWLDAHNVVGILSLPFHLVMALSVVGFGLHDYFYAAQDPVFYAGQLDTVLAAQNPYYASAPPQAAGAAMSLQTPAALLASVHQRAPGFVPASLIWRHAGESGATVFVAGNDPRYLARSGGFALMDAVTGRFINPAYLPGADNGNGWSAASSAVYALHFGSYGGSAVQWGYFLLGLAGAFLFYSGNLLWIESRRKAQRNAVPALAHTAQAEPVVQRRGAELLAALSVGVSLGCIAGISASLVAGKLLHAHVADLHAWHARIYYAVFLLSVGWAVWRGAAPASLHLLLLGMLATAAIPLSSLAGVLLPGTGLWMGSRTGALGVDEVAALGAACLAWMWLATSRRVKSGRPDSVWFDRSRQKSAVTDIRKVRGLP